MALIKYITFGDGKTYSLAKLAELLNIHSTGKPRDDWNSISAEEWESAEVDYEKIRADEIEKKKVLR